MAGTRSSTRQAAQASSSPNSSQGKAASNNGATGNKRKAEAGASSKPKRGKKGNAKEQKTIEETMPDKKDEEEVKDVEMKDATGSEKLAEEVVEKAENGAADDAHKDLKDREDAVAAREDAVKEKEEASTTNDKQNGEESSPNKDATTMDETGKVEPEDGAKTRKGATTTEEGAVQESSERDDSTPSSILEKGIIYFFFRGRVGIDEPSEVGDLARSYIVLRPLPHGAKLGEGAIGDAGNNRLLALPKKVLPKSPRDRFMIFVEKANTTMDDIKNNHLKSSDYETKTAGARHTPAATPVAEGVYAITITGRESHLAYILTIPAELSEVQEDVGLKERGSFITSVKNPQYSGPAGANLPQGPEYSKEYVPSSLVPRADEWISISANVQLGSSLSLPMVE